MVKDSMILYATNLNNITLRNSTIFQLPTFGPTLHVRIDNEVFENFELVNLYKYNYDEELPYQFSNKLEESEVELIEDGFEALIEYTPDSPIQAIINIDRPWVDIPTEILDDEVGLHTYILEFKNKITGDILKQYFNYTIQNDNLDKPYIYMDRTIRGNNELYSKQCHV